MWAGIIALADQYAKRQLGLVNPAIYRIAGTRHYRQAFHDITAGTANTAEFPRGTITGYRAGPGWDPVTGWVARTPRCSCRCSLSTRATDESPSPQTAGNLGRAFVVRGFSAIAAVRRESASDSLAG
jgi:hypothetical protein